MQKAKVYQVPVTQMLEDFESLINEVESEQEEIQEVEEVVDEFKIKHDYELKYPFNIGKLYPRQIDSSDDFRSLKKTVYDVSLFSSMRFLLNTHPKKEIMNKYPGWKYRIYAYRTVSKTKDSDIKQVVLAHKYDKRNKFIHVDVELH